MPRFVLSLIAAVLLTIPAAAQVTTWKVDPAHSAAQFSVRYLSVSTVRGAFTKLSGTVQYDAADPAKSSVDVTIETASVDTRVEMRDNDLRSPKFLDVQKYPTITFKSKRVESAGPGKLKVTGDLTIHGVTKEVVLDIDGPSEAIHDPWGNMRRGASATTKINRRDFGITEYPSAVISDGVAITIDAEMIQPAAAGH